MLTARLLNRFALWVAVSVGVVFVGATSCLAAAETGRDWYQLQEFDKVVAISRGQNTHESMVVCALAFAERHALYGSKDDKRELASRTKALQGILGAGDLPMLASLAAITENPNGSDLAAAFMEKILAKTSAVDEMDAVLRVIAAEPGPKATASALKALHRHLSRVRTYVSEGGTMPPAERYFFARDTLLRMLVAALAADKTEAIAQKCLVLIEEPALEALGSEGSAAAVETVRKIGEAIAKRERKWPGSGWHGRGTS